MNTGEILKTAYDLVHERGAQYGDMAESHHRVATICSEILRKTLTARDIAMIFAVTKLCRSSTSPHDPDHYVDAINYLAFVGELSAEEPFLPGLDEPPGA